MKRAIRIAFLCAAMASVFAGCRQWAKIHGDVENLPDGMVYLMHHDGRTEAVDSVLSEDGKFTLRQPGPLPDLYFLRFADGVYAPLAVEGSELYVTGNFDQRGGIRVTGSPANELLDSLFIEMRPYEIMFRALDLELRDMAPDGVDSLLYRGLRTKQDSVMRLVHGVRRDFVAAHPDNLVSAFLQASQLTDSTTRTEAAYLLGELSPNMPDNAPLERLRQRAQ